MATHLDVAVGIADLVTQAAARASGLDVERHALGLLSEGLPPPLTFDDVADVLRSESLEAGVWPGPAGHRHAS